MSKGGSVIPTTSDGDFSIEDWTNLTNMLRFSEPILRRVADEMSIDLLSSARWPELRLKKSAWWTVRELRISLHSGHAKNQAGGSKWVINLVRYPRFPWLPFGASEVESIDLLGEDDLMTEERLKDCMHGAVRRAFASVQ